MPCLIKVFCVIQVEWFIVRDVHIFITMMDIHQDEQLMYNK